MIAYTDRDKLWEAWPDGYLATHGLITIDNWICLGLSDVAAVEFVSDRRNGERKFIGFDAQGHPIGHDIVPLLVRELWRRGCMLPNVDPTDRASWACLLDDLARAAVSSRGGDELGPDDTYMIEWQRHWGWQTGDRKGKDHGRWRWFLGVWKIQDSPEPVHPEDGWPMHGVYEGFFDADTTDPAEALVLVRIQIRGRGE